MAECMPFAFFRVILVSSVTEIARLLTSLRFTYTRDLTHFFCNLNLLLSISLARQKFQDV